MNEIGKLGDQVEEAIADGIYSEAEHLALRESLAGLRLQEKLALLRKIDDAMATMPGGGDHGAWTALLRVQTHLRQLAAGPAGKQPLVHPIDFVDAKKILRNYAYDGKLDDDERRTLKRLLVRLDARHVERLLNFATRREEFAFQASRKTGFMKVRHFIEKHRQGGEWKPVDVDESEA